jgi:hypothetical protein
MGDMTELLNRFGESVESVPRIFGEELDDAVGALDARDQKSALAALLRIRNRAALHLSS